MDAITILRNHSYEEIFGMRKDEDLSLEERMVVIFCLVFIVTTILALSFFSVVL